MLPTNREYAHNIPQVTIRRNRATKGLPGFVVGVIVVEFVVGMVELLLLQYLLQYSVLLPTNREYAHNIHKGTNSINRVTK